MCINTVAVFIVSKKCVLHRDMANCLNEWIHSKQWRPIL